MFAPLNRIEQALLEPARNALVCNLVAFTTSVLLPVEAFLAQSKEIFLLAAAPTAFCALSLIYAAARTGRHRLDASLLGPTILAVLLYFAGVFGCIGAYSYFALTHYSVSQEELVDWGLLDKRPLVFGYVMVAAFIAFHWFMVAFFFDRAPAGRPATAVERPATRWAIRIAGAGLIAFLAYCWIDLPALRSVIPGDERALARFYDLHSHVHLAAMEQIRLGAMPYLEAQTQYGVGNQLLSYGLTKWLSFSNHGFYAANILLNAVCVVAFFVALQQILGLSWALAGLVGWVLLPSPYGVMDVAGWAVLTRWLAIPVLSLLLARQLLNTNPTKRRWWAPVLTGAIWGLGGFLSQENLSGGLLVLALCMASFGAASDMPLRAVVSFAALFVAGGVAVFLVSVSSVVGPSHFVEAFQLANVKSGLVMAGHSNSIWSDNLGLSIALNVVNGRLYPLFEEHGELRALFQTYGFAVLLTVVFGLLARFLARRWAMAGGLERQFVWKFAGVTVGAYVLHLFTLLRSDLSHLDGASLLLPLFLVMLPLFAWRCLGPGRLRSVLLLVSVGVLCEAAFAGRADIGHKIDGLATVGLDSTSVSEIYGELRASRDRSSDLAASYSPIPRYQAAFRNHPDFTEVQELFGLLHSRLRGRRVELAFYPVNALIAYPDLFYFFGGFRSVSGITSPKNSIWLRSEQNVWIDKVVNAPAACVFFEVNSSSRIFEAWKKSVASSNTVVTEPIIGKRSYGMLSCKT